MRIHADENISRELVTILRRRVGWDVVYACESETLRGQSDLFHFQEARRTGRLLLTRDKHFLDPARFPYHKCVGIMILEGTTSSELETILLRLVKFLRSSLLRDATFPRFAKLIASRGNVRVRKAGPEDAIVEKSFSWLADGVL